MVKSVKIHKAVVKELKKLDLELRIQISELIGLVAAGESVGMPVSRPMPNVFGGAHEFRVKDMSGQYRVFYYTKKKDSILVFHLFKKKTRATPKRELDLAKKRLRSIL